MTTISCKKCGSTDLFTKPNGAQVGAYCSDCGAWLKWVGKEEQRLIEKQIEMNKRVPEEIMPEIDLSQVSDEDLLAEVARRMR